MKNILFVTWDGPQVNYLESLFLPIFAGLEKRGYHFDVLQFRWGTAAQQAEAEAACARAGVGYRAVTIWRRGGGLGPFASTLLGRRALRRAVRAFGSDAIMPRSLMPAIATLAAGGAGLRPVIYDSDGLAADERVDVAGLSQTSATYRILRDVEAQIVRISEAVLVRSGRSGDILRDRAGPATSADRFHVVANGRDPARFAPGDEAERARLRDRLDIKRDAPLLVYAGSIGPQYRFDQVGALARAVAALRPDARLLVLSGAPDDARRALGEGAPLDPVVLRAAPFDVPAYLAAADLGIAFRSRAFSMQGVAPVKLAEYLLCGLPVVGTTGIGDTSPAEEAGLFCGDGEGPEAAARWLVETIVPNREEFRQRARAVGLAHFSLDRSINDYARALGEIAS